MLIRDSIGRWSMVLAGCALAGMLLGAAAAHAEPLLLKGNVRRDSLLCPAALFGDCTDYSGGPVHRAKVKASTRAGKLVTSARTNSQGDYTLRLRPGLYVISVGEKSRSIRLKGSNRRSFDFVLNPER